jgi:hypothetical protein
VETGLRVGLMERHERAKCWPNRTNTDANRVRGTGNPNPFKTSKERTWKM